VADAAGQLVFRSALGGSSEVPTDWQEAEYVYIGDPGSLLGGFEGIETAIQDLIDAGWQLNISIESATGEPET
jgi:hypothetical protein